MTAALAEPREVGARGVMNRERAAKVAAKRIGCSVDEYLERRANAEKWCPGCSAWHAISAFTVDRYRSDGYSSRCREATRAYNHAYFHHATCERCGGTRHAQGGRFCRPCYRQRALEHKWIKWALKGQRSVMRRRDIARAAALKDERRAETSLFAQGLLSLEAPLAHDRSLSLADVVGQSDDPHVALEQAEIRALLGNVDLDDIRAMNDETVEWLRFKLSEAGYTPGRIRDVDHAKTQERRKEVVLRRSESSASATNRLLLPEDVKPEARGHAKLMKIAKTNERRAGKEMRRMSRRARNARRPTPED